MSSIGITSQQVRHRTGGRIYAYQVACALRELGHSVTLYVDNAHLPFRRDYDLYLQPKVERRLIGGMGGIPRHDLFIGLPLMGATAACQLGMRYGVPVVICVLDVLSTMKKVRDDRSPALQQSFWTEMIAMIQYSGAYVFVLADTNKKPCAKWVGIPEKRIFTVYPAVNDRVIDTVPDVKREYRACFVSRLDPHKKFAHAVDAVKPLGLMLDVVTAKADPDIVHRRKMEGYVNYHIGISDYDKFEIIKRSLLLISGSVFEGFGMFVTEALACSTPVVCYPLDVFKEIVNGSEFERYVYLAKDRDDLTSQVMRCISDEYWGAFPPDTRFGMNEMIVRLGNIMNKMGV